MQLAVVLRRAIGSSELIAVRVVIVVGEREPKDLMPELVNSYSAHPTANAVDQSRPRRIWWRVVDGLDDHEIKADASDPSEHPQRQGLSSARRLELRSDWNRRNHADAPEMRHAWM
jgi:hypothetical protein